MNNIINQFRLVGYKINELPNGHFIIKRADDKCSLVDPQGNVMLTPFDEIQYFTDHYYLADSKDNSGTTSWLYNKYGKLADKAERYRVITDGNIIQLLYRDEYNGRDTYNVYAKDGSAHFNCVGGKGFKLIQRGGKPVLVYEGENGRVHLIDRDTNIKETLINSYQVKEVNDHYIMCVNLNDKSMVIVDYDSNEICRGANVSIDNSILQSSKILKVENGNLYIIDSNGNTVGQPISVGNSKCSLTPEPDVICVQSVGKNKQSYLLNIRTGQKSNKYIRVFINEFIGVRVDGDKVIESIDRKTFQPINKLTKFNGFNVTKELVIIGRGKATDMSEYYTLDFRPLIHEFS